MTQVNVVILNREALFEFFGKMALPPWTDDNGVVLGGDIDCAPIAQEIENWVNENEQKSPVLAYATSQQLLEELKKRKDHGGNFMVNFTIEELVQELKDRNYLV